MNNDLVKYLNNEEYDEDKCIKILSAFHKDELFISEILDLIKNRTPLLVNDFINFVNFLFYDRKIIIENDELVQINDDNPIMLKPFLYLPYYGVNANSKNYNLKIDYYIYKYILKDNIFYNKKKDTLVKLFTFLLNQTSIEDYNENVKNSIENQENFKNEISLVINDFIEKYRFKGETFHKTFFISRVQERNLNIEDINRRYREDNTLPINIGDKGELIAFELIDQMVSYLRKKLEIDIETLWVSKDITDSMDYDILVCNYSTGEAHAFEIKTTTKEDAFHDIKLSNREYNKFLMGTNINNNHTNYKQISSYTIIKLLLDNDKIQKISFTFSTQNNNFFKIFNSYIEAYYLQVIYEKNDILLWSRYLNNDKCKILCGKYQERLSPEEKNEIYNHFIENLKIKINDYKDKLKQSDEYFDSVDIPQRKLINKIK